MTRRILPLLSCLCLLAALPTVRAQANPDGVEVLTRGPIHEAFANPVDQQPRPTPVITKEPRALIEEQPADQRPEGDNTQWIPGYWAWDDERSDYIWVSGFWRAPPPGRQWVPGHWGQVDGGWQWVSGYWAVVSQEQQQYLPPPPPPVDAGPSTPAPSTDASFVPGNWVYADTRYVWRPGFWSYPRPGWMWVPAHYTWTPSGYVFVEGYWDYALRDRGLLFAPVVVTSAVYTQPGFVYRPSFVVYDDGLMFSLFVRPSYCHYYFGDYFGASYVNRGYVSWINIRFGSYCPDPIFSYYRWNYRGHPGWEHDLRNVYVGRANGTIARPPRTLVEQTTIVNNIVNNNTVVNNRTTVVNQTTVNNVRMVGALSQVDRSVVKLQPVTAAVRAENLQTAQQLKQVGVQRAQVETQLRDSGPAPVRSTDSPRVVKLALPPTPTAVKAVVSQPPPLPYKPVQAGQHAVTTPVPASPAVITAAPAGITKPGSPAVSTPAAGAVTKPPPSGVAPHVPPTTAPTKPAPLPQNGVGTPAPVPPGHAPTPPPPQGAGTPKSPTFVAPPRTSPRPPPVPHDARPPAKPQPHDDPKPGQPKAALPSVRQPIVAVAAKPAAPPPAPVMHAASVGHPNPVVRSAPTPPPPPQRVVTAPPAPARAPAPPPARITPAPAHATPVTANGKPAPQPQTVHRS
jgi:hypothetical protein